MADTTAPTRIAFVCVQNAGRSQMAYAFARREVMRRGLEDQIELTTGGTQPVEHVHEEVARAMHAVGIDVRDRTPREATSEELQESDYVITMGCSAEEVCPAGWSGSTRDWTLDDPDEKSPHEVGEIRDEIKRRVSDLLDELQGGAQER